MSDQLVTEAATYTTHNKHDRTSLLSAGFDPTILTSCRLQTYTLDRTATGIDFTALYPENKICCCCLGKGIKLRPAS